MSEEITTEVRTETTETSQDGVEINSATPEVEIPVQPETETTTEETRTETTTEETQE